MGGAISAGGMSGAGNAPGRRGTVEASLPPLGGHGGALVHGPRDQELSRGVGKEG